MSEALIKEVAQAILSELFLSQWKIYLLIILISMVVGFFSSYAGAYAKKRGEQLATKADLNNLVDQVKRTTAVAEEVKIKLSHEDWVARESRLIKRTKLEELMQAVHEARHWLDQERGEKIYMGAKNSIAYPLPKVERLAGLYFPELKNCVYDYCGGFRAERLLIMESYGELLEASQDANRRTELREIFRVKHFDVYGVTTDRTFMLEKQAQELMLHLISG